MRGETHSRVAGRPFRDARLRTIAAGLAFAVSVCYLFHPHLGLPGLVTYANAGTPFVDPRPALFVASGVALVAGVNLALFGVRRKPLYVLGIVLLLGHLLGYVWWHLGGHGGVLPGVAGYGHHLSASVLVSHLAADSWALVTKLLESGLCIVLAVLLVREHRQQTA